MPAKTFTTWSALHQAMLDQLADFVANRMQAAEYEYTGGATTRRFKYRTLKEFQEGLTFVKQMADLENPATAPARRTYARQGGRG